MFSKLTINPLPPQKKIPPTPRTIKFLQNLTNFDSKAVFGGLLRTRARTHVRALMPRDLYAWC